MNKIIFTILASASFFVSGVFAQTEPFVIPLTGEERAIARQMGFACATKEECANEFNDNFQANVKKASGLGVYKKPEEKQLAMAILKKDAEALSKAIEQEGDIEAIAAAVKQLLGNSALQKVLADTAGIKKQDVEATQALVTTAKKMGRGDVLRGCADGTVDDDVCAAIAVAAAKENKSVMQNALGKERSESIVRAEAGLSGVELIKSGQGPEPCRAVRSEDECGRIMSETVFSGGDLTPFRNFARYFGMSPAEFDRMVEEMKNSKDFFEEQYDNYDNQEEDGNFQIIGDMVAPRRNPAGEWDRMVTQCMSMLGKSRPECESFIKDSRVIDEDFQNKYHPLPESIKRPLCPMVVSMACGLDEEPDRYEDFPGCGRYVYSCKKTKKDEDPRIACITKAETVIGRFIADLARRYVKGVLPQSFGKTPEVSKIGRAMLDACGISIENIGVVEELSDVKTIIPPVSCYVSPDMEARFKKPECAISEADITLMKSCKEISAEGKAKMAASGCNGLLSIMPPGETNWVNHTWTFVNGTQYSSVLNRTDSIYADLIGQKDKEARAGYFAGWEDGAGDERQWQKFGIPKISATPTTSINNPINVSSCPAPVLALLNNDTSCHRMDFSFSDSMAAIYSGAYMAGGMSGPYVLIQKNGLPESAVKNCNIAGERISMCSGSIAKPAPSTFNNDPDTCWNNGYKYDTSTKICSYSSSAPPPVSTITTSSDCGRWAYFWNATQNKCYTTALEAGLTGQTGIDCTKIAGFPYLYSNSGISYCADSAGKCKQNEADAAFDCPKTTITYTASSTASSSSCPSGYYWSGSVCASSSSGGNFTCPSGQYMCNNVCSTSSSCTAYASGSTGSYSSQCETKFGSGWHQMYSDYDICYSPDMTNCKSYSSGSAATCPVSSGFGYSISPDDGCKQTYGSAAYWNGSKCVGGSSPTASIINILRHWFSRP